MFGKEALALKPHGLPESPKTRHHLTSIVKSGMSPACVEVNAYRSRSTTLVPTLLFVQKQKQPPAQESTPPHPFRQLRLLWSSRGCNITSILRDTNRRSQTRTRERPRSRYIVNSGMACRYTLLCELICSQVPVFVSREPSVLRVADYVTYHFSYALFSPKTNG